MNQMLDKAMKAASTLPEPEQTAVAEGILEYVEMMRDGRVSLSATQRAGVEQARSEARAGDFTPEAEMAALWRKFGL